MLIQLSTLKTRLGIEDADVKDDEFLTNTILSIGARFENETNRVFARAPAATYQFRADEMNLVVDRYPIEAVTSFELKITEALGWVAQTGVDYLISPSRALVEMAAPLGTSKQLGRVTFAGGYVLPGDTVDVGETALPQDLVNACQDQAVYQYQNRDRLGLSSVSGSQGGVSLPATVDLLPGVVQVIKRYERWRN